MDEMEDGEPKETFGASCIFTSPTQPVWCLIILIIQSNRINAKRCRFQSKIGFQIENNYLANRTRQLRTNDIFISFHSRAYNVGEIHTQSCCSPFAATKSQLHSPLHFISFAEIWILMRVRAHIFTCCSWCVFVCSSSDFIDTTWVAFIHCLQSVDAWRWRALHINIHFYFEVSEKKSIAE